MLTWSYQSHSGPRWFWILVIGLFLLLNTKILGSLVREKKVRTIYSAIIYSFSDLLTDTSKGFTIRIWWSKDGSINYHGLELPWFMSHTTLLVHQNVHEREKDCTFVSFCLQVPDVLDLLHLLFICSWMRLLAWAPWFAATKSGLKMPGREGHHECM